VWAGHAGISDTHVYERYGDAIEKGAVPYRDFRPEYPPGALAVFVVPSLLTDSRLSYERAFGVEMALLGAVCVGVVFLSLRALGVPPVHLAAGVGAQAVAPLLLGPLLLTRFDLFPAALVAAALLLALTGHDRSAGGVLGAAISVKLYPIVLVPILAAWAWRRRGRHEALLVLGFCAVVAACIFLPFALIAPSGLAWSVWDQLGRPLQIESLGAAILLALHQFGMPLGWSSSHGSQNLTGTVAAVASASTTVVQAGALLWIWTRFARRASVTEAELVGAATASLVAFVALGKVLSPQFLIWLLAGVALVRARSQWAPLGLLVTACALTRGWFPHLYHLLVYTFDPLATWLVVARDLTLVALLAVLLRQGRERARSS